jgi:hypothetical protein
MKKFLLGILALLAISAGALTFLACGKRGEGEKTGEKIDNVFKKDGPMEKAGEKVDDALDK